MKNIRYFVLPKHGGFNFYNTKKEGEQFILNQHGLIKLIGKLVWHYEWHRVGGLEGSVGAFEDAYQDIKDAGWDRNYTKTNLREIYNYVKSEVRLVNADEFGTGDYIQMN